jgi:hypothetical protein
MCTTRAVVADDRDQPAILMTADNGAWLVQPHRNRTELQCRIDARIDQDARRGGQDRYWIVTFITAGARSLDWQEIGPGQRCGVPFPGDCLACLPAGLAVIGRRWCAAQPSRQIRT